jgi:hypothetical protein
MQTLQPATNTKISHYLQQASKKLADSQLIEPGISNDPLSQSLSLSPKIEVTKKPSMDYLRHSSDNAAMYY